MQAMNDLTSTQWQVADAIARQLVVAKADVNELRKSLAYLRAYADREEAGKTFFLYLDTLAKQGNRIGHSKKTQGYLASIAETCQQYLSRYTDDVSVMLQILGWAARLMQYYKTAGPIGEVPQAGMAIPSEREAEIRAVTQAQQFEVGQRLAAIVVAIKGNKVTYEMLGTIRLTQKEPKQAESLSEGQAVTVEIVDLKDDGSIRKVKCVD